MTAAAVRTTCAYCGVGCGIRATVTGERTVEIAGDPQKRTRPPLTRVGEEDGTGSD